MADRMISMRVKLIPEQKSEGAMVDALRETKMCSEDIDNGTTAIGFDVQWSGESITAPHLRICPLRVATYKQLVHSSMLARRGSLAKGEIPHPIG